jgi:eukaryotic translation initiation factor 2-alpha kinase 4
MADGNSVVSKAFYDRTLVIQECIGKGGFSEVYKITNNLDGMTYAVKQIPVDPENMDGFLTAVDEVRILARLSHPHIVRYYNAWVQESPPLQSRLLHEEHNDESYSTECDTGGSDTSNYPYRCCIQLELCDLNLKVYLNSRTGVDHTQSLKLFQQILQGVRYLHDRGVIHGDLKPENILMTILPDSSLCCKLSDFGLSTVNNTNYITKTSGGHDGGGTPLYSAPEIEKSTASDVFSLGIILLELLYHSYTEMERYVTIRRLRQTQTPPRGVEQESPIAFVMIRMMTTHQINHRPSVKLIQQVFSDELDFDTRILCRDIVWEVILKTLLLV